MRRIVKNNNWYIVQDFNFKKFKYKSLKLKDIDKNTYKPERVLCFKSEQRAKEFMFVYNEFKDITLLYFKTSELC